MREAQADKQLPDEPAQGGVNGLAAGQNAAIACSAPPSGDTTKPGAMRHDGLARTAESRDRAALRRLAA
jgi:hypothetical protein